MFARYGLVVGEKVVAQATPLLGAALGMTLNFAFADYYREMAQVHFRLRKLERVHDPALIGACYARLAAKLAS